MMLYSSRYKLSKIFDKWAKKERVLNCSESAITWLYMNNLIDEHKAKEFLEKHCPPRDSRGRFIKRSSYNHTGIILPKREK